MADIQNPNNLTTVVTGLVTGNSAFRFSVTDNFGRVTFGVVNVSVSSGANLAVDAGEDQYLDENVSTTNFYGTVEVLTPGTTVVSISWSVLGGVVGVGFSTPTTLNTGVTGIPVADRTTFRLTVVGSDGQTYTSDIDVSVAAPSEIYFEKDGVFNQYDPDNLALNAISYLPQGYDPLKPGGFPCVLFMHGAGENGDVTTPENNVAALYNYPAGLMYFLYNQIFPMKCVVIAPHNRTGIWTLEAATKALVWAQENFAINPDQFYITGLSSGGTAVCNLIAENPTLFAAGISCNTTANNIPNPGVAETIKNVPILFISGYNDTQVPPFGPDPVTGPDIDALNSVSPKGLFGQQSLIPWTGTHGPDTWNEYCYDKTAAPFDFENDFLLFYNKDVNVTMSNYVTRAETSKTWYDYSCAAVAVSKMTAGSSKTALLNRLSTLLTLITTTANHRYWFINFASEPTFSIYTINSLLSSLDGSELTNLLDVKGVTSSVGFTVVTNPGGVDGTGLDNDNMGMSSEMFKTSFVIEALNSSEWHITGLNESKFYDIFLYASTKSEQVYDTGVRAGVYSRCNGDQAQSKHDGYNTMFTLNHYNIQPTSGGVITILLKALYSYSGNIVGMLVREKASGISRSQEGKFNFVASSAAFDSDWGSLMGNPTTAVRSATDPVSGWVLNTVSTDANHWLTYSGFFADDNIGPAATYPSEFPTVVARSGMFSQSVYFDPELNNYNVEAIGIPGMGFPAGRYRVKVFASSVNEFAPTRLICKIGNYSGKYEYMYPTYNNTTDYYTFEGTLKEGETIKLFVGMTVFGASFINAVKIQKIA